MPPRKSEPRRSDVSTARFAPPEDAAEALRPATPVTADAPGQSAAPTSQEKKDKERDKDKDAVTIEDLTLPKSIITRLAKGVLPPNTQIQANAILALSKSATVFINHLASFANEHTVNAGKKTISPDDVFKALDDVEFEFLKPALEAEFAKFNAIQTEKRTSYRQKVRASKGLPGDDTDMGNATAADDSTMADTTAAGSEADADAPRAKKARVEPSAAGGGGEVDDAETEPEEEEEEEEEEDEDVVEDDDEEEEDGQQDEGGHGSGDETQDALEERHAGDDHDEALEGDESD